jgi:hypothetical protein
VGTMSDTSSTSFTSSEVPGTPGLTDKPSALAGFNTSGMSDSGWFSSGWTTDGTDGSDVPPTITCIDCGGRCHLLTIVTEEQPLLPGDVATYRCEDCRDRWDLIVPGGEDEDGYDQYGERNDGYPEGW